jgi:hypothetical protein
VRFSGRIVASRLLSAGLAASLLLTSVTPAFGVTNAKIEARKQDAARAQAKLDDLSTQLELRAEELGQVESQLEKTRASIAKTERVLDRGIATGASTLSRSSSGSPTSPTSSLASSCSAGSGARTPIPSRRSATRSIASSWQSPGSSSASPSSPSYVCTPGASRTR